MPTVCISGSVNWVDRRRPVISQATVEEEAARERDLLAELFARQFPQQLPELGESQLPVVVLVQRAHELLDGGGVAGVLRERRSPSVQGQRVRHRRQPVSEAVLPPNG